MFRSGEASWIRGDNVSQKPKQVSVLSFPSLRDGCDWVRELVFLTLTLTETFRLPPVGLGLKKGFRVRGEMSIRPFGFVLNL